MIKIKKHLLWILLTLLLACFVVGFSVIKRKQYTALPFAKNDPFGYKLGKALLLRGDKRWTEAERAYRVILSERPDAVSALFHLGEVLEGQGKTGEARLYWKEVVRRTQGRNDKYATGWRKSAKARLAHSERRATQPQQ